MGAGVSVSFVSAFVSDNDRISEIVAIPCLDVRTSSSYRPIYARSTTIGIVEMTRPGTDLVGEGASRDGKMQFFCTIFASERSGLESPSAKAEVPPEGERSGMQQRAVRCNTWQIIHGPELHA